MVFTVLFILITLSVLLAQLTFLYIHHNFNLLGAKLWLIKRNAIFSNTTSEKWHFMYHLQRMHPSLIMHHQEPCKRVQLHQQTGRHSPNHNSNEISTASPKTIKLCNANQWSPSPQQSLQSSLTRWKSSTMNLKLKSATNMKSVSVSQLCVRVYLTHFF